jgi:hypothetical protein
MSEEQKETTFNEIDKAHIEILSRKMCESVKVLNSDLIDNCDFAPKLMTRPSYTRVIELNDKLEQALT